MSDHSLERRLQPRRTPRQARSAETRARILDAARAVFSRHGYAAGTTNRIAAEASLSVGSLYQYFPNKDAILVELVDEHIHATGAALTEAFVGLGDATTSDDLAATVREISAALARSHAQDSRLHRVLFEESPRPASLLARLRDLEEFVVAVTADALVSAGVGGDSPSVRARFVVVTIESLVHRLVATDDPLDPELVADEITRMVVAYLTVSNGA